ncbi:MAG: radical SAM protein [Candidatus Cloacimonetes bacterium]|nr:radical SAM protein [Candidatus Cloacimonadota bacterium]
MKTFCPLLWEEMYINEKGDVYTCCHQFPGKLGNIKKSTLKEIYNSRKLQKYRRQSIQNRLLCAHFCTLLSPAQRAKATRDDIKADYTSLKRLKICIGTGCNIRCTMCWQDHDHPKVLETEMLRQQIDLDSVDRIDIQGGEPLYIRQAREFYDHCAAHNVSISFLTNGMLLNDEWINKVIKHSHMISISVNAATARTHEMVNRGSKWDTVISNLHNLRQKRDEAGSNLRILAHMTIIRQNVLEIPQFISMIDDFAVDEVKFGFDPRLKLYLLLHPALRKKLKQQVRKAMENTPDNHRIDTSRLRILKLI